MHNDIMAEHNLTWLNGHKIHASDVLYDLNWISFAAAVSALFVPIIVVLNVIFYLFCSLSSSLLSSTWLQLNPAFVWNHCDFITSCFLHHKSSRLLAFFVALVKQKSKLKFWGILSLCEKLEFCINMYNLCWGYTLKGFGWKWGGKIKPKYIISKPACSKSFCFSQLRLKFI